jgi:hypothetical protein
MYSTFDCDQDLKWVKLILWPVQKTVFETTEYEWGFLWRRQSQQSFNTSTLPFFYFLPTHYMFVAIDGVTGNLAG